MNLMVGAEKIGNVQFLGANIYLTPCFAAYFVPPQRTGNEIAPGKNFINN
jgi:hypothetical protein